MNIPSEQSVTGWLAELRRNEGGEQSVVGNVWNRYFLKLVRVAQKHLRNAETRVEDEEDVALSVLHSLCAGLPEERFAKITNRDELWILLATMTHRKCVDRIRRNVAQKRGGGKVVGEADLGTDGDHRRPLTLDDLESSELTPESIYSLQEDLHELLNALPAEQLRQVAVLRMEGFSTEDIAEKLKMSGRSVRRKLDLIRDTWLEHVEE